MTGFMFTVQSLVSHLKVTLILGDKGLDMLLI